MKNISVIIPARIRTPQEADWLRIALESIPARTPVIIVNDHSPVPWQDVAEVVDFKNCYVKALPDDKHGLAACRNYAMSFVETDYFFNLDADDYLMPNALEISLAKYGGSGFLYGSTLLFNDKQQTTYAAKPWDICELLKAVYWPNGCLQQTENWRRIGGWDETLPLYEDWDYWLRSAKAGITGHHIPDVLYAYRQNPNGIIQTLKRSPDMTQRARAMIEEKHKTLFSGEDPMCSGCGGGRKAMIAKAQRNSVPPAPRVLAIPAPTSNGLILLTYTGGGLARSFYGKETGTAYRFGGNKRVYGYVAQEDVPGFLKLRDGKKYLFTVEQSKPVEEAVEIPAPELPKLMEMAVTIPEQVITPAPKKVINKSIKPPKTPGEPPVMTKKPHKKKA